MPHMSKTSPIDTYEAECLQKYNQKKGDLLWRRFKMCSVQPTALKEVFSVVVRDEEYLKQFNQGLLPSHMSAGEFLGVFRDMKVMLLDEDNIVLQHIDTLKMIRVSLRDLGEKYILVGKDVLS